MSVVLWPKNKLKLQVEEMRIKLTTLRKISILSSYLIIMLYWVLKVVILRIIIIEKIDNLDQEILQILRVIEIIADVQCILRICYHKIIASIPKISRCLNRMIPKGEDLVNTINQIAEQIKLIPWIQEYIINKNLISHQTGY